MTTSTTLGCIFMTPLICKLVLGAVVPVDAGGIVVSTFQVVLAPIFLGVGFNTLAPGFCKAFGRSKFNNSVQVTRKRYKYDYIPNILSNIDSQHHHHTFHLFHLFFTPTPGSHPFHPSGGCGLHRASGGCLCGQMCRAHQGRRAPPAGGLLRPAFVRRAAGLLRHQGRRLQRTHLSHGGH